MSQADIQRFVSDLKDNQALLDEVKSGALGLAAVVDMARAKGYDITVDEAKAYIREQANQDLSDEQLDAVAGGKSAKEEDDNGLRIKHHRDWKKTEVTVQVYQSQIAEVFGQVVVT